MKKTATIQNLLEGFSEEDIAKAGTTGQVQLTKFEEGKYNLYAYFNTVQEAEIAKDEWESESENDSGT